MAHQFPIRIYYDDTDAAGVVYYGNYLKFAEHGRTEWLRELAIEQSELREEKGIFFVVRHCAIDYLAPGRLDDELIIETSLLELGNASITMQQDVQRVADKRLLAQMKVTVVCVNEHLSPARIPLDIRVRLQKEA
ncbi:MAG: tol-pal system-associated acyl-CoA thioesterase [Rickettsiales bacterium]|nr:tol-pal system-associated acyl-CoA thioesterase [Rickettsiales bacterium]